MLRLKPVRLILLLAVGIFITISQAACFPSGPPPGYQSPADLADSSSREAKELWEGVSRGAYWWADADPVAIAAFSNYGIDSVAIRLGKVGVETGLNVGWESGGDCSVLSTLPGSFKYRLVVETATDVWNDENSSTLADLIEGEIVSELSEYAVSVYSIEVRLPDVGLGDGAAPDYLVLENFLYDLEDKDIAVPIEIGMNPSFILKTPRANLENFAILVDGVVAYFMDYDYTDVLPRITDRQWIDAVSAELQELEIPFTAVLPIYNRALAYRSGSTGGAGGAGGVPLTAVDIDTIKAVSTIREKGSGGTEFTIDEPLDISGDIISPGDQIRVLKSIEEIDQQATIKELLKMAPMCREVALFRFPLVPGFDPEACEVLIAAGWSVVIPGSAIETDDAEKLALDKKHDKAQQIIWMITLGLMAIVLMRMFSRGAGQKQEGEGK